MKQIKKFLLSILNFYKVLKNWLKQIYLLFKGIKYKILSIIRYFVLRLKKGRDKLMDKIIYGPFDTFTDWLNERYDKYLIIQFVDLLYIEVVTDLERLDNKVFRVFQKIRSLSIIKFLVYSFFFFGGLIPVLFCIYYFFFIMKYFMKYLFFCSDFIFDKYILIRYKDNKVILWIHYFYSILKKVILNFFILIPFYWYRSKFLIREFFRIRRFLNFIIRRFWNPLDNFLYNCLVFIETTFTEDNINHCWFKMIWFFRIVRSRTRNFFGKIKTAVAWLGNIDLSLAKKRYIYAKFFIRFICRKWFWLYYKMHLDTVIHGWFLSAVYLLFIRPYYGLKFLFYLCYHIICYYWLSFKYYCITLNYLRLKLYIRYYFLCLKRFFCYINIFICIVLNFFFSSINFFFCYISDYINTYLYHYFFYELMESAAFERRLILYFDIKTLFLYYYRKSGFDFDQVISHSLWLRLFFANHRYFTFRFLIVRLKVYCWYIAFFNIKVNKTEGKLISDTERLRLELDLSIKTLDFELFKKKLAIKLEEKEKVKKK